MGKKIMTCILSYLGLSSSL